MRKNLVVIVAVLSAFAATAQPQATVHEGEIGISAGAAHYFGDLNTRGNLNRPKPAVGLFYRKQFNNYLALRISAHYLQLGYSDIYSKNIYQQTALHTENPKGHSKQVELSPMLWAFIGPCRSG